MVGSVENGCISFPTLIEGLTLKKRTSPLKMGSFSQGYTCRYTVSGIIMHRYVHHSMYVYMHVCL